MKKDPCSLIISPGYADSGPDHWQSIWLRQFPHSVKVEQKDWLNPSLESWLSALDAAVLSVKNRQRLQCRRMARR
ncbi:MAG: alpha/beta hydrolase [Verrucomicrobia bacterium]|nr:alpha/beta hydrolase [Verrucomicrobiota bacterium]